MKKWLKKIITFALAIALVLSLAPADVYATGSDATETPTIVAQGVCNETVNWSLDSEGVMTISGTGAMPDYYSTGTNQPWYEISSSIKAIVIEDGVTYIGDNAFYKASKAESLKVAGSVKEIGATAFSQCSELDDIVLEEGVEIIGNSAFYRPYQTVGLNATLTLPTSIKKIEANAFYNTRVTTLHLTSLDNWWDIEMGGFNSNPFGDNYRSEVYVNGEKLTELVVPEDVTEIKNFLFTGWANITKIKFHDNVTKIGTSAFYSTDITELDLPDNLTEMNPGAFSYTDIKEITIPESLTLLQNAFQYCRQLETVNLPANLERISAWAFQGCTALKDIDIPKGVVFVGSQAFDNCTAMEHLVIPDTVTSGSPGGMNMSGLKSLTMPIVLNANHAYDNPASTLTTFVFTPGSGLGYTYTSSTVKYTPWYINGSKTLNVTLQEGITRIGSYMFYGCTGLKELTIPSTVTEIGSYAIPDTTKVTVYEGTYGETWAKANKSSSYYTVICNYQVTSSKPSTCMEQGWAKYKCAACGATKTEALPLADHVWGDAEGTLSDGTELKYCTFGCGTASFMETGSVTATGVCGDDLTYSIYDGKYLLIEGTGAMYEYDVTDPAPWMGDDIIYACVKSGVTTIGDSAFSDCTALERIDVADTVTTIDSYAFYGCTSLKEFTFPENVTAIAVSTFEECENLEKVYAHKGIETIGASAFKNCDNLTIVGWTGSEIYEYAVDKEIPFESLGEFGMCGVGAEWYLVDGVLTIDGYGDMYAYADETEVPWYGKEIKEVIVGGYVGTIADYAFKGMTSLKNVELSMNVGTIGNHVFDGCTGLEEIELTIATYVGNYAFSGCTNLKKVIDSEKIVVLGEGSFYNCQSLTEFKIADAASGIPAKAFQGCTSLTSFTMSSQFTTIGASAFEDCALTAVTLPAKLQSIGERAFANNEFTTVALNASLTTLGKEAFVGCDKLTDFTVAAGNTTFTAIDGILYDADGTTLIMCPAGKEGKVAVSRNTDTIGEAAFSGCKKVTEVSMPSALVTIEEEAFKDSGLTTVEIPAGVKNLEVSAFKGCNNLTELTVDEDNTKFKAENGLLLLSNNTMRVLLYFGTEKVVEIPEGYYYVEDGFLSLRPEVEKVLLPHSLEKFESTETFGDAVIAVYDNAPVKYYAEGKGMTCESRGMFKVEWTDTDTHTALAFCKLAAFLQENGNSYTDRSGLHPITYTYNPSSDTISVVQTATVQAMTTTAYFILGRYGIYESDIRYDCKLNGSLDNGYYCTIKMQPEDIDGSDDYRWSIYIGKYNLDNTTTRANAKKAATSSLNTMIIGMDVGLYKMLKLQITDFGFTSYYDSRSSVHSGVISSSVTPTCTESGYEGDTTCSLCGAFIAGKELPATGHTEVTVEAAEATCTEPGHGECVQCSVCKEFLSESEITPALGHSFTVYESDENATCEKDGTETAECDRCDATDSRTAVGSALGHSFTVYDSDENATCEKDGTETAKCDRCDATDIRTAVGSALGHVASGGWEIEKEATCTEAGSKYHTCMNGCGARLDVTAIPAIGHKWSKYGTIDKEAGTITYECENDCGETKVDSWKEEVVSNDVSRVYGGNRFKTSLAIANEMKDKLGVDQFDTVIVASGVNFPDALAGSYLSAEMNAPILMVNENNVGLVLDYIKDNLREGGKVYLLGGTGAVPQSMEDGLNALKKFEVERLKGKGRYDTNLAILNEVGVTNETILVCTGTNFADSLSGSATGLPILLVNPLSNQLTDAQKEFLDTTNSELVIVGGAGAVSEDYEKALEAYDKDGKVERLAGKGRYQTSVKVAERFFDEPSQAVTASALAFPDGLCGGPLAYVMGAPLILTGPNYTPAADYMAEMGIESGIALGGTGALSEDVVRNVFAMSEDDEIIDKKYN